MSKYILLLILTVFVHHRAAFAQQKHDLQEVAAVTTLAVYAPQNPHEIAGYAVFYKRTTAMRENDVYGIDLLDTQLIKTHSVKVLAPLNAVLVATACNGAAVAISFYSPEKGSYVHKSYDMTLVELGTRTEKGKPAEMELLEVVRKQELPISAYYFGLRALPGGKGFVRAGFGEKGGQFKLACYDNTLKNRWSKDTPDDSPYLESFTLLDADTQYVAGISMRRKSMLSPKIDYFLTIFEAAKGKKALDIELDAPEGKVICAGGFIESGKGKVTLVGEYFDKKAAIGTDKSKGVFLRTFEVATKKEVAVQYLSWGGDIAPLLPEEEGKRVLENAFYAVHGLLPATKGGNGVLVLEQFKKIASKTEPLVAYLGENTGGMRIKTGHVLVLELAPGNNDAVSAKYLPQTPQEVTLLPGTDLLSAAVIGQMAKDTRRLGCAYVRHADAKQGHAVLAEDRTGSGSLFLRAITATAGQGLKTNKSELPAVARTQYQFLPAAQGGTVVVALDLGGRVCRFGFL